MKYLILVISGLCLLAAILTWLVGAYYGLSLTASDFGVASALLTGLFFLLPLLAVACGWILAYRNESLAAYRAQMAGAVTLLGLALLLFNSIGVNFVVPGLFALAAAVVARRGRGQKRITPR